MNRYNNSMRESLVGGRNFPAGNHLYNQQHQHQHQHQHRRVHSLNGASKDTTTADENQLDLFSRSRRSLSVASSDESSEVSVKLGKLSVGSAKLTKSGIDDLLSSTDGGKHDYDWLLTPPGTPLFPSSDGGESQPNPVAPRSSSLARSGSTMKASRLSVSQSESNNNNNHSDHPARSARSSSVTRSSISASPFSTYSSNRSNSILNTSSASVSSYTRPASPSARSVSSARSSTPSSRPTASRSSTPSRTRPSLTSSSVDTRTRPSQSSRPSTPSSRPQNSAHLSSSTARSSSRPSTPTHRNPITSTSPAMNTSTSAGRVMSNGRCQGASSRPSSPSPRPRPQQPIVPPDFPLDTPPNLRTTLPDRPVSAGRSRPGGAALTMKSNPEATGSVNMPRRHSSPVVTRGRLSEPPGRGRTLANGHTADIMESRRTSHSSEPSVRRPVKSTNTATDSTGFGRNISKKSLDMAIRHMDIRNGAGSIRQLSGTTLFPQSIRSVTSKPHSARGMESVHTNGTPQSRDSHIPDKVSRISRISENGNDANERRFSAKLSEVDIYESSRYDTILLKEDLKNTNWLHSIDDKSDQGSIFDNGFEPLPEPFGLL